MSNRADAAFVPPKVIFVYMPGFGKIPGSVIAVRGGANMPGDPIAMRRLGEMYQMGLGVPADQFDARLLLECAATSGAASRPIVGPIEHFLGAKSAEWAAIASVRLPAWIRVTRDRAGTG